MPEPTQPQRRPDRPGTPSQLPAAGGGPPWYAYVLSGLGLLALALLLDVADAPQSEPLSYTGFKQAVRDDRVATVTFTGNEIEGRFSNTAQEQTETPVPRVQDTRPAPARGPSPSGRFTSAMPEVGDPQLLPLLEAHGVEVTAAPSAEAGARGGLTLLLFWMLILGGFFYLSWRMQKRLVDGQSGGPFGFGKSGAKRFRAEEVKVGLADVAGLANAKAELGEIIGHLADPGRFRSLGARIPKGVLLVGPPGTGKTLLARAVAGEAGVPFFSISGSEFVEMFVGVGAARVRDLFHSAKQAAPCVIFIDEIDAVGRARGAGLGGGHDEREQTLNQILSEMDGFEPHEEVVVLAATNRPDVLDSALLRPGRFDRKVYLELPDRAARRAILGIHARKIPLAPDVDLDRVADRTIGFSGADLANLVNEAALLAGRRGLEAVDMGLFAAARDKIVLGAEREQAIGDVERRLIAVHESGHALLAWLLPNTDPLEKVTIIPRGQSLGMTEQLPEEERHTYKQSYLRDRIGVMLGGRIAEQLVFGEVTTGAEADLEQATELARRMVSRWGMSEAIGPVAFPRGHEHVFLGRDIAEAPEFSDTTAERIDDEIKALIVGIEADARELMRRHRDALERLAERLLAAETLDRAHIEDLLRDLTPVGADAPADTPMARPAVAGIAGRAVRRGRGPRPS